jgi:hypothetical protein
MKEPGPARSRNRRQPRSKALEQRVGPVFQPVNDADREGLQGRQ